MIRLLQKRRQKLLRLPGVAVEIENAGDAGNGGAVARVLLQGTPESRDRRIDIARGLQGAAQVGIDVGILLAGPAVALALEAQAQREADKETTE
mgnify:CR=1 FL=1